jgi:hypothetical protein
MKKLSGLLLLFVLFISNVPLSGQVEITLRKSFIDSLKNHVTIATSYQVIHAHKKPNAAAEDGDLHVAGLGDNIGLPVVAEIMNAKDYPAALKIVHENEGTGDRIRVTGAWRIWCEHTPKGEKQDQGTAFPEIINSNPPHIFEIHPVTQISNIYLQGSLRLIVGFRYKKPEDAFRRYLNTRCKIEVLDHKVRITTNGVGYNYAEFWIEPLDETQKIVDDGRFVYCRIMDMSMNVICPRMRMAVPKDSPAESIIKVLKPGKILHVAGIPRIDLNQVSQRVAQAPAKPGILEENLPVEMIVVSVLN